MVREPIYSGYIPFNVDDWVCYSLLIQSMSWKLSYFKDSKSQLIGGFVTFSKVAIYWLPYLTINCCSPKSWITSFIGDLSYDRCICLFVVPCVTSSVAEKNCSIFKPSYWSICRIYHSFYWYTLFYTQLNYNLIFSLNML